MITKTRTPSYVAASDKRSVAEKVLPWSSPLGFFEFDDTTAGSYFGTYVPLEESITYGVRNAANPCSHTKLNRVILLNTMCSAYGWHSSYPASRILYRVFGAEGDAIKYGVAALTTGWFATPPTYTIPNWEANSSRALQAMWPSIKSEVSGLNFLWELQELKHLPLQVAKLLGGFLSTFIPNKRNANRHLSLAQYLRKAKRGLKGTSEAILISEFGIRPLVDDLIHIGQALTSIREKINIFLAAINTPQVRHCRFWLEQPADQESLYTYSDVGFYLNSRRSRTISCTESWYTATMKYQYDIDPATKRDIGWLATLDTFGLNLNPRIIWDGIPWSFAVDWLLKIGPFLEQLQHRNVMPIMRIEEFVHSYKRSIVTQQFLELGYNREPISGKTLLASEIEETYIRKPHIPSFYSALQLSGFSTREIVLSSALLGARIKP